MLAGRRSRLPASIAAAAFVAPALIVFTVFFAYPAALAFQISLRQWDGLTPLSEAADVGLENYRSLLADDVFWQSARNTGVFALAVVLFQTIGGFLLAFGLWYFRPPFMRLQRTAILIPTVLSGVLVALIWRQMFAYDGPINELARSSVNWFGDPSVVLWTLAWVSTWQWLGWSMLLYIAAFLSIPDEMIEAARVDGATPRQVAWRVVRPMVRRTTALVTLLNFIGAVQTFDIIWISTRGGPNHASETLTTYAQWLAFDAQGPGDFGRSAAVACVVIVALMAVAVARIRLSRD